VGKLAVNLQALFKDFIEVSSVTARALELSILSGRQATHFLES